MVVVNKKAVMKIVLYFALFLLLYGFLFHNEQSRQRSRLYEYGDTAATCRVALTSDFMDDTEMFQSLAPVLREYGANLALFVADGAEDGGEVNQITEYVFLSEPAAFANVRMAEGRFLTEADNGTDVYVSSESSGVPRQVGKVDLFPCGAVLTIRPINPDDIPDRLFDRYAHLTLRSLDDEPYLKLALQSSGISVTSDESTLSESVPHFYVLLAAVFLALIFISLSLYEILNSYQKIAVQKLFGRTNAQIFLEWLGRSVCCITGAAVAAFAGGFLLLLREVRASGLAFMGKMLLFDGAAIVVLCVVVSVPFVYVRHIRPSEMLRGKKPVRTIEGMNFAFKTAVGTASVLLLVSAAGSYRSIQSFLYDRYSYWNETKDYYITSRFYTKYEDPWDSRIRESSCQAYRYFNEHGAILADFDDFVEDNYKENMEHFDHLEYRAAQAVVNPNYLQQFHICDAYGHTIAVSEDAEHMMALVPMKYKADEAALVADYRQRLAEDIEIIWIADGQKAFSFRIDINPANGNCVEEPVLLVVTLGNTDRAHWYYTEDYVGEPLKVKALSDRVNAKEEILKTYYQYYDSENCRLVLANVYGNVAADIARMKTAAYGTAGMTAAFAMLLAVLIGQSLYLYFEECRQKIAVMRLMGVNFWGRYSGLLGNILASWVVIGLLSVLFQRGAAVMTVSLGGLALELVGLTALIRHNEMKRVVSILKNK